ncbi:hypothetical protein ABW19_dt0201444 [Dactylella cylindrospora]|nr:hypothetical protein ABW19_dt0201444 [Dactylella cylindrospora]
MRPSNVKLASLCLLPIAVLEVIAQSTTTTLTSSSQTTPAPPQTTTTETGVNRITYAHLPSCASSCITSAVRSIPCTPFIASCFCALPTGRLAYELPVECVKEKCGQDDIDQEKNWRESVCQGFTETKPLSVPSWPSSADTTTTAPIVQVTEVCEDGWKACPIGLNGGCCPRDNYCNLLDCQPSPSLPTASVTKITSPSEVPPIEIASLFPPCSHKCISEYLPQTSCGLSPLNSTCFCRLHDFYTCLSPSCSEDEINTFVSNHIEICKPLWYFYPYDPTYERWCDLVEGEGKRGRPWGYDIRMGSLERKCPDWWEQRDAGKRFGIVLGIGILSLLLLCGCHGYWERVGKRVTEIDKRKAEERKQLMGITDP